MLTGLMRVYIFQAPAPALPKNAHSYRMSGRAFSASPFFRFHERYWFFFFQNSTVADDHRHYYPLEVSSPTPSAVFSSFPRSCSGTNICREGGGAFTYPNLHAHRDCFRVRACRYFFTKVITERQFFFSDEPGRAFF